jgi:hypothetical protein
LRSTLRASQLVSAGRGCICPLLRPPSGLDAVGIGKCLVPRKFGYCEPSWRHALCCARRLVALPACTATCCSAGGGQVCRVEFPVCVHVPWYRTVCPCLVITCCVSRCATAAAGVATAAGTLLEAGMVLRNGRPCALTVLEMPTWVNQPKRAPGRAKAATNACQGTR